MCHNSWSYGIHASHINPKLNQSKSICFFNKPHISSLHCRDTLMGVNAQSLPFQCMTKTAGTRFQQRFQPPNQTGVTLLTGRAACCLHNRLRMDRYPHVGGGKIFIALDQSHMFCELIVSLFCVSVRPSMIVCMMGWLAPNADYWNGLSWAVVSGAED